MEYDQHVSKRNQQLAYQGVLDNCKDVGITEPELQQAQEPLNPSIKRPEMEVGREWENTFKMCLLTLSDVLSNIPLGLVRYHHHLISNDNSSHQIPLSTLIVK